MFQLLDLKTHRTRLSTQERRGGLHVGVVLFGLEMIGRC